jgi:hypothetical protein
MQRDGEGGFSRSVDLPSGRSYRFRYLLDNDRWENDWAADAYVPNDFSGDDSVVDLTALVDPAPPPAKVSPKARGSAAKADRATKKAPGATKADGATKKAGGSAAKADPATKKAPGATKADGATKKAAGSAG